VSKIVRATIDDALHAQAKGTAALAGLTMQQLIEKLLREWLVRIYPGKLSTPSIKLRGK